MYGADFVDGEMSHFRTENIRPVTFVDKEPTTTKPDFVARDDQRREKLHPKLKEVIAAKPAHELVEVVIGFTDDVKMPRFAQFDFNLPMTEPTNVESRKYNETAIEALKRMREPEYKRIRQVISGNFGGEVREEFWISKSIVASVPVGSLAGLVSRNDVISIEPSHGIGGPSGFNLSDGRARINSDRWYNNIKNGNLVYGRIAFIDTGIRSTHTLFDGGVGAFDCVTSANCVGPSPGDNFNHGTSVAGVLAGNSNLGDSTRGVTPFFVHSYRVGDGDWATGVPRAMQQIPLNGALVVSMSGGNWAGTSVDSWSIDADNLVATANIPFIAAAGNEGAPISPATTTLRSPGIAHQVISVGAVNVDTWTLESLSSRGPAEDGRTKPDITAPTCTITASNASDTATSQFCGTSGATPFVSSIAAMYKRWFSNGQVYDAGHVYTSLIASGSNNLASTAMDNIEGSGRIYAFPAGHSNWGKTTIAATNSVVEFSVPVGTNRKKIDVAIWWPELNSDTHNDIDVHLIRPDGSECARGFSSAGIWEKLNCDISGNLVVGGGQIYLPSGTYKVRIKGWSVPRANQVVYWTMAQT